MSETTELKSALTRAVTAERRANNHGNQLAQVEESMAHHKKQWEEAEKKWEARVKEYQARIREAEEKLKRERQGGKERIGELESNSKYVVVPLRMIQIANYFLSLRRLLQQQVEGQTKRIKQLEDLVHAGKAATTAGVSTPHR